MKLMKKLLAVLIVGLLSTNALAYVTWTNGAGDNNFVNPANWNTTPVAGDDFRVQLAGTDLAILSGNTPWAMDDLYVAYGTNAVGELTINGGTHNLTNRFRVGVGAAADGLLTMTGGTVNAPNTYSTWGDSGKAIVNMSGGAITVDRLTLGQKGVLETAVTMTGGSLTISASDQSPASSTGCLRFGDTTHEDGVKVTVSGTAVLTTEVAYMGWFASTTPGDANFMVRANDNSPGLLTIDGGAVYLTGSTLNAWSSTHGDTVYPDLEILKFEDINGDDLGGRIAMESGIFALAGDQVTLINDALADGYITHSGTTTGLVPVYNSGADLTTVVVAQQGDLNGDGQVGSADLDIIRANWGGQVPAGLWSSGDISGDGTVGSADLDIIRANWGNVAAAAVPEPNAIILLLAAVGMALARRRRR